jgi:hypothetical protein
MPTGLHVLLVDASFAVALALDRRMLGRASVDHVDGERLLHSRRRWRSYDLVILCPYLAERHRACAIAAIGSAPPPPLLVLLVDARSPRVELVNGEGTVPEAVGAVLRAVIAPVP